MQYLDVPFREKDQAKALGARWDAVRKKWFVPSELAEDLTPFQRWLPAQADLLGEEVDTPSENEPLSLSQLLQQVEAALQQRFPTSLWVRAEIAELSERRHLYLHLVETDANGQELASVRATLWQSQIESLVGKFVAATGSTLAVGQKVLLKVQVRFHPRYGLSLNIEDIDPSYTLGDIAAHRSKLREALIAQGLYERNKQLPLPEDYFRVAVLSPPKAAGLGDFQRDALQLQQHGLCEFHYFHAAFQGERVECEFMAALDAIEAQHAYQPFDALIVIRGGGAQLDLHHLNRLTLAQRLAQMPMPVLTGIGHERDTTILDEIAALRLDTPSKVIAHIRDTIFTRARKASGDWQAIRTTALQQVRARQQVITHACERLHHAMQFRLQHTRQRLFQHRYRLLERASSQLQSRLQQLQILRQAVQQATRHHLLRSRERLRLLHHQVTSLPLQRIRQRGERLRHVMALVLQAGPAKQLRRGFALVKDARDRPITRAAQLKPQQHVLITFEDGPVKAKVEDA